MKKILTAIWNEFVYGGHITAFAAMSIVFTAAILLEIKITWDCLAVVYVGTQSVYLYNRYKELDEDSLTNSKRTKHIKKYAKYIPFILVCFVLVFVVALLSLKNLLVLFFGLALLFAGLLYTKCLKKCTKKIVGFKSAFVSLSVAFLVIFLALYYSSPFNLSLFLIFLFVFLKVLINTNFYDIRDIKGDQKEHLFTLPIILGEKRTIKTLNALNIFAGALIIASVYLGLLPKFSLILLLTVPCTFYYLKKAKSEKINIIYYVLADGEVILWSFLILLGELLL